MGARPAWRAPGRAGSSWCRSAALGLGACAALAFVAAPAASAPVFFGPSAYLSSDDVPDGFYASGSPEALEDFEDGSLDHGLTASSGAVRNTGPKIDSVDADDGSIDGSGSNGASWFTTTDVVRFTFDEPVTAAALVQTDGSAGASSTFEAFDSDMQSLGTIGPAVIGTNETQGATDEDRFFGVADPDGIAAIELTIELPGVEVDHVQYGVAAIPEPASAALVGLGTLLLAAHRRRRA